MLNSLQPQSHSHWPGVYTVASSVSKFIGSLVDLAMWLLVPSVLGRRWPRLKPRVSDENPDMTLEAFSVMLIALAEPEILDVTSTDGSSESPQLTGHVQVRAAYIAELFPGTKHCNVIFCVYTVEICFVCFQPYFSQQAYHIFLSGGPCLGPCHWSELAASGRCSPVAWGIAV